MELVGYNDKQVEAILKTDGPILVIAGAGSGKTKVLTTKIAYLVDNGVPTDSILAITFTNKAAKEMKERVIRDMKAEKKRELVVERLKKEFNGNNMAEIASKYGTSPQPMSVNYSEYGNMESAAVGKIAELQAGKSTVVGGTNSAYLVSVTQVDKAIDKKQTVEQMANQFKSSYQLDGKKAQKEAENYFNMLYTTHAYNTVLITVPGAGMYRAYPLAEAVKFLVYNNIDNDIKLVDNRSKFYGASENNR